jgi:predicted ArsR family transcriptional regulator
VTSEPSPDEFRIARQFKRDGTSADAAASAARVARLGDTHRKIWRALRERPRTADEIAADLGLILNTARARCSDLIRAGWAERTGETRLTAARKRADVLYAITKEKSAPAP